MCPVRSIIDVQVNSADFEKFYDKFEEYQKHLEAMPDNWSEVGAAGKKTTAAFAALFGEMASVADSSNEIVKALKLASKAQAEFHKATRTSGGSMKELVRDAEKLTKEITGIGKFLFKLGAIGFGTASAGVYGLDRLGQSAVTNQRSARGIGLTQGAVKAFNQDFGRYINESTLGNMANAQSDTNKWAFLSSATKMSISDARGAGADTLAIRSSENLRKWMNTPGLHTDQTLWSSGFGAIGYSMEDARRIGAMSDAELAQAKGAYGKDKNTFDITGQAVDKWYALTNAIERAGNTIDKALTEKLSALGPSIGELTSAISGDVTKLINSITPEQLDTFRKGIDTFTTYMGSSDFKQDMGSFVSGIKDLAEVIGTVVKWLKNGPFYDEKGKETDLLKWLGSPIIGESSPATYTLAGQQAINNKVYQDVARANGMPINFISGIASVESSFGINNGKNPKSTAEGPLGQTVDFRKQWGAKDASQYEEIPALVKFYQTEAHKYNYDVKKVIAAYYEGESKLDKDLEVASKLKDSSNWINHLSNPDTKGYVNKVMLVVDNKTGSDVSISANAAAATH